MTPTTLHALRRLLFFSVNEAARYACPSRPEGVTERYWQYWESGARPIPADVSQCMTSLVGWRERALSAARAEIQGAKGAAVNVIWYPSLTDWLSLAGREALYWRPQCSVVADLAAQDGATLVLFDLAAYTRWLGKRRDGEGMRANWAGLQTGNVEH